MPASDKRTDIIAAALELIAENGFHGSPMAMIAGHAGVSAGTIYRYFENKDELIRSTYELLEERFLQAIAKDYPADQPFKERFCHMGEVLLRYFIASPMELRFVEQFHNSPYGIECRRDRIAGRKEKNCIITLFDEALEMQIVKDLPMAILFSLTFGALIDVCRHHILQFVTLDEPLIARTVEACWDAVRK